MNIGECMEYAEAIRLQTGSAQRSAARKSLREAIAKTVAVAVAEEREQCAAILRDLAEAADERRPLDGTAAAAYRYAAERIMRQPNPAHSAPMNEG